MNKQTNDKSLEEDIEFVRASGDCICQICGLPYKKHRMPKDSNYFWLNELCDGSYVKL